MTLYWVYNELTDLTQRAPQSLQCYDTSPSAYVSPLLLSLGLAVGAQAKLESLVSNYGKPQQGGRPVPGQRDDKASRMKTRAERKARSRVVKDGGLCSSSRFFLNDRQAVRLHHYVDR